MCGVAAIVRMDGPIGEGDRGGMARAMERLRPRGPDGEGGLVCAGGRALLGHRRLAIQDLTAAAAQPMQTDDGSLSLVYNGELYNTTALRDDLVREGRSFRTRSDTEVLLHALAAWGTASTLERVRGMFSFVAVRWQEGRCRVEAAVDAAGMKPLVWSVERVGTEHTLYVASDCDALRAMMPRQPALDPVGLCHVLSVGYCPPPRTVWRGVHAMPAGARLDWAGGEARCSRHWTPPEAEDRGCTAGAFDELLVRVANDHLAGDVPVGMFLSAGLDSASVALALARAGTDMERIQACTLATDSPTDESADAAALARHLGMPHRIVRFEQGELEPTLRRAASVYDQPQGYTALMTSVRIAERVRRADPALKVVLGGDGGDEALGGYAWHRVGDANGLAAFTPPGQQELHEHRALAARVADPAATGGERMGSLHALARLSFTHRYLVRTFGGFHPAEAAALLGGLSPGYDEEAFAAWLAPEDRHGLPLPRRTQRLDVLGFCAGSIQPKLDRACMAVGLELRAPYLDRRMLEWGLALPVDPREDDVGKLPIRSFLARGVEDGLVPRQILSRPKQGFSLRLPHESFEPLAAVIRSSRLTRDGMLRKDWERFLVRDPDARRVRLFTLAMLAEWYDARL